MPDLLVRKTYSVGLNEARGWKLVHRVVKWEFQI